MFGGGQNVKGGKDYALQAVNRMIKKSMANTKESGKHMLQKTFSKHIITNQEFEDQVKKLAQAEQRSNYSL